MSDICFLLHSSLGLVMTVEVLGSDCTLRIECIWRTSTQNEFWCWEVSNLLMERGHIPPARRQTSALHSAWFVFWGQLVETCPEVPGWERQDAQAFWEVAWLSALYFLSSTSSPRGIRDTLSTQTFWPSVPLPFRKSQSLWCAARIASPRPKPL